MIKTCRYCTGSVIYTSDEIIYNKKYGMIYICQDCGAFVGCHKGTNRPFGTLANKELREKRKLAHKYFDNIWKRKKIKGFKNARKHGYKWLSNKLNINPSDTHIGMFEIDQCDIVIKLCKPFYREI